MASHEGHPYHPRDAIALTTETALITGGFGAFVSGVQNTLTRQNLGIAGFFTKFGGTTATYAAMGGSYAFAKTVAANLRETEDSWNNAIGGFFAGSVVGLRVRTFPAFFGYGATLAVLAAAFNFTGGALSGFRKDPHLDEVGRKEALRQNRRRPIEETVSELGEGRGIYPAGYEERRRERLKEHYGLDLTGVPSSH
ncbi:NADH-ubiquinone oxidoreductase 213 kDa subunit [Trichodelitschia bisporula]|uniref:NADH-ubiquinone oxidoreductase 213 kDa subunit n=1 Tax=Trichodelitschia bisporula TaxID=703511 RepID=A0A6G1HVI0_9PEZI|nr:NADH-ubiquinone oxidoreductase 213 kDa subunit [Trichodelitschia bisporula]